MSSFSVINARSLSDIRRLDPEYFQPRYLADADKLEKKPCFDLETAAFITDGIHGSPDEVEEGGVTYLSAKCVRSNDFILGRAITISNDQHNSNPRTSVRVDDVLITTVGTIGNAAVVQKDILPANSDRHLGIIRVNKDSGLSPYFLAAFLNSEYGIFQTTREATGNVQLNLFIEKIKKLRIPRLKCSIEVDRLVRQAYKLRLLAANAMSSAETIVTEALNLKDSDMTPSLTYEAKLSDMIAGRRFGAEFYMPAKATVLQALSKSGSKPLGDYVANVKVPWNPQSAIGTIRNFDLGDAMEPFLDDRFEPVSVDTIKSSKKRLRKGDVVISRLRSYLRQIAVVQCGDADDSVGSSEFVVLRPTDALPPETILAYLRSKPVQTILRWSQDGTNHPRFDEATLFKLPVPQKIVEVSDAIASAVGDAIQARRDMAASLSSANKAINAEINSVAV